VELSLFLDELASLAVELPLGIINMVAGVDELP
jgi:hypothetical protein